VNHLSNVSKRVLLVEDEPFVAMVAQQLLEDDGFSVTVAATGHQALSCAGPGAAELDAAIVDLGLPDMRGEELVARLRSLREDLPVVIASGYGLAEMRATFRGHARMGFVSKPYDGRALCQALDDAAAF
jgi:CheY-like chemotaxis protein